MNVYRVESTARIEVMEKHEDGSASSSLRPSELDVGIEQRTTSIG